MVLYFLSGWGDAVKLRLIKLTASVLRINPEPGVQASVAEPDHLFFQKRNTSSYLRPRQLCDYGFFKLVLEAIQ